VSIFLYQLLLTKARLQGMFPNPANDNNFRLVLGGPRLTLTCSNDSPPIRG
jgi:hypothetical protein